ncbi:hypothetical protein LTR78_003317 [Recurvomyces mirabilis]|uniref:DUF6590 domain-containing protein n=1 Tax=Recurvomyces mirabilis TaxID=574656 RepID=A0AAE0WS98_9PEZI|nr:hypothetical protein LTR78_003317 [Recurvomyces mirabilis]
MQSISGASTREASERKSISMSLAWSEDCYGEWVHSTTRRFVVVREGNKICSVLPITTYSQQGVRKPGVRVEEHGMIYTGRQQPVALDVTENGRQMQPIAIRVDADKPTERLDEWSRIDYARTHTIDHKTKVKSIGKVNTASIVPLLMQYRNVAFGQSEHGSPRDSVLEDLASLQITDALAPRASYYSRATSAIQILMKGGLTYRDAVEIIRSPTQAEALDDHESLEVQEDGDHRQSTKEEAEPPSSGGE